MSERTELMLENEAAGGCNQEVEDSISSEDKGIGPAVPQESLEERGKWGNWGIQNGPIAASL